MSNQEIKYKSSFNGIADNELLEYILTVPELKNNSYVQWRLNKISKLQETINILHSDIEILKETINHI